MRILVKMQLQQISTMPARWNSYELTSYTQPTNFNDAKLKTMDAFNWTSFSKRININADEDEIYQMWATPTGIEKWFLRQCELTDKEGNLKNPSELFSAGDNYLWRWYGWPDDVLERGTILRANGKDELQFTFGQVDAEHMICTVKIFKEEGEAICEMTQENIPDDEKGKSYYHLGCLTGWTFFLTNLKSILEGGVDLRNKNEKLTNMFNS